MRRLGITAIEASKILSAAYADDAWPHYPMDRVMPEVLGKGRGRRAWVWWVAWPTVGLDPLADFLASERP